MSDKGSNCSSPTLTKPINKISGFDEDLNDHRNQSSLPIRIENFNNEASHEEGNMKGLNIDELNIREMNIEYKNENDSNEEEMNTGKNIKEENGDQRKTNIQQSNSKQNIQQKNNLDNSIKKEKVTVSIKVDEENQKPHRNLNRFSLNSIRKGINRRINDDDNNTNSVNIKSKLLQNEQISIANEPINSLKLGGNIGRFKERDYSCFELSNLKDSNNNELEKKQSAPFIKKPNKFNQKGGSVSSDIVYTISRMKTNDTVSSDNQLHSKRDRRASHTSITVDSDADSQISKIAQETEEDVCFPMLREQQIDISGINFDEIENFIKKQNSDLTYKDQLINDKNSILINTRINRSIDSSSTTSCHNSKAALKYTPKNLLKRTNAALLKFSSKSCLNKNKNKNNVCYNNANNCISTATNNNSKFDSNHSKSIEKENSELSTVKEEYDDKLNETYFRTFNNDNHTFENAKKHEMQTDDALIYLFERFSFFRSQSDETIHSPDLPSLIKPGKNIRDLFINGEGTWWLDCSCPSDAEIKVLAKTFGIHPLTSEDIRMRETREKVELFRNYYFVCFHTFETDKNSDNYLELINVYIVVFRTGVLSFHFTPIIHPANVRRRVRQLRDYVDVSADWLCYALIDDITDGFAPVITEIEYEADAIEDSVFVLKEVDFSHMLQRIGESRKMVMKLMRLLSSKADVIKMFAKRCQDEAAINQFNTQNQKNSFGLSATSSNPQGNSVPVNVNNINSQSSSCVNFGSDVGPTYMPNSTQTQFHERAQPRADIALYLGDIQDHIVTMFQNLAAYEKIFSRSHSNYLAYLQVQSFNNNNRVTEMLSKVTIIGTLLVPLNLVTGLFGMNVNVPGQNTQGLYWFLGIIGFLAVVAFGFLIVADVWIKKAMYNTDASLGPVGYRLSIKDLKMKTPPKHVAKSIISSANHYD